MCIRVFRLIPQNDEVVVYFLSGLEVALCAVLLCCQQAGLLGKEQNDHGISKLS